MNENTELNLDFQDSKSKQDDPKNSSREKFFSTPLDIQEHEVKIKSKQSSLEFQAFLPQQIEVKGADNKVAP